MTALPRRRLACLALIATTALVAPPLANARVTQITLTATESPTFEGGTFGAVGAYERISGRIAGAVDPKDPLNAVIVDIGLAPKNAQGLVTYSADFQILRPIDRSKGNKRLLFEITNRGRTNALEQFNDSKTLNDASTAGDPGTGFLMNRGFTLVSTGWDPTVGAGGGKTFRTSVPVAKNPDGSSITGPVVDELVVDKNATPETFNLAYAAASSDKTRATLTVRKNYADTPVVVPAADWDFVDDKLRAIKLTSGKFGAAGSFGPTALYEFAYVGKDPIVAALGLAAIRDLATFLRDAKADDAGNANPLASDIEYTYTTCSSQPCRAINDFVLYGFNEAERTPAASGPAKRAIDGILNWKAGGSGLFINYRFAQPVRTHRQHVGRHSPEFQFPFADQTLTDPITEKTGGRLQRCQASNTCPKIFAANSSNDYWAKAASMLQTDSKGQDLGGLPDVRYYLLSSFPHNGANGPGICAQPRNPMKPNEFLRAMLIALDEWVSAGKAPPDDRMPRVKDGTLVSVKSQDSVGFPKIPGVVYNGVHHTGDLFDFGPDFDRGIISVNPPKVVGTPYPVLVPKTDADGNDIAGVRLPEVAVPVATYTGWALRADGLDGCDAAGQRIPFAKTKADREAKGDPRLSLQERYPDHAAYVARVTQAAQELAAQRFLLPDDAAKIIAAAQAAAVP